MKETFLLLNSLKQINKKEKTKNLEIQLNYAESLFWDKAYNTVINHYKD